MNRIAITINVGASIWENGINQNAIYLANLLKETGYAVYLIHELEKEFEDIASIKTISRKKSYQIPFSLVIQLGFFITESSFELYKKKNKNVKLVQYKCGNEFIDDMESMLFNKNQEKINLELKEGIKDPIKKPHQIWSIPQMENTNLQYYAFKSNQQRATVVPFIWEPIAIEDYCNDHKYLKYTTREINRIAIMEPNISIMKNILLPIAVLENQYIKHSNLKKIHLIGATHIKENKQLLLTLQKTKIYSDKLVSADPRLPSMDVINKFADIVFSWQWENNLNYLWLDIAWMGWPIIHNGNMCQDVGYYYEDFNIKQGQEILQYAIKNHNKDTEYLKRNREVIKRYTFRNKKLREQYKILVENVLNNRFQKWAYDWKTNSIL